MLIACLLAGCGSWTPITHRVLPDSSAVIRFNHDLEGRSATVVLLDESRYRGSSVFIAHDTVFWYDDSAATALSIPVSEVRRIEARRGFLPGYGVFALTTMGSAMLGAYLGSRSVAEGSDREAPIVYGAAAGALAGVFLGSLFETSTGAPEEFVLAPPEPVVRPH